MTDPLPLSYINQYAYCPRRFWYMYAQSEMEVNAHVLRGVQNHERAHTPGYESQGEGVRIHRRVYVFSERWQISGFCDLLEEHPDGRFVPVEYKQGKQGRWMNDQAQLCAQALCLEEMTGASGVLSPASGVGEGVRRPASSVRRPASGVGEGVRRPASGIGLRTLDFGRRTSDAGLRTLDFGRRTSDFGLRTPDFGLRTSDSSAPGLSKGDRQWPQSHVSRISEPGRWRAS